MPKLRRLSGREVVSILRQFGFTVVSQLEVWHIVVNGIKVLDEAQSAGLTDAAKTLREAEIHLLQEDMGSSTKTNPIESPKC